MWKKNRGFAQKKTYIERCVNAGDIKAYNFSKKRLGFKKNDVNNHPGYWHIMRVIYGTIGEHVINNPEGVYIEGLGYFGALMYSKTSEKAGIPKFNREEEVHFLNNHTDGAIMTLHFMPMPKRGFMEFRTFIMDGTFNKYVVKNFSENLRAGVKYFNNVSLFLKN